MRTVVICAASFLWGNAMGATFGPEHPLVALALALLGVPFIIFGVHALADTLEAK